MPNLNRRGRGGVGVGGQQVGGPGRLAAPGLGGRKASASATRAPVAAAAAGSSGQYGLSRQHTTSDPRLLQQQQQGHQGRGSQLQMQPPQRGYSMPRGGDRRTPEVSRDEKS